MCAKYFPPEASVSPRPGPPHWFWFLLPTTPLSNAICNPLCNLDPSPSQPLGYHSLVIVPGGYLFQEACVRYGQVSIQCPPLPHAMQSEKPQVATGAPSSGSRVTGGPTAVKLGPGFCEADGTCVCPCSSPVCYVCRPSRGCKTFCEPPFCHPP